MENISGCLIQSWKDNEKNKERKQELKDNGITKDEGLQGNEKIEEAIAALQQELTDEMLAHALTVIRRRMREKGQQKCP